MYMNSILFIMRHTHTSHNIIHKLKKKSICIVLGFILKRLYGKIKSLKQTN